MTKGSNSRNTSGSKNDAGSSGVLPKGRKKKAILTREEENGQAERMFRLFDVDHSGTLSHAELGAAVRRIRPEVSDADIHVCSLPVCRSICVSACLSVCSALLFGACSPQSFSLAESTSTRVHACGMRSNSTQPRTKRRARRMATPTRRR